MQQGFSPSQAGGTGSRLCLQCFGAMSNVPNESGCWLLWPEVALAGGSCPGYVTSLLIRKQDAKS